MRRTWTIGRYDDLLYAIRVEDGRVKVSIFNPRTKIWKDLPPLPKHDMCVHLHGVVKKHHEALAFKIIPLTSLCL